VSTYSVAHLEEITELDDGRCPGRAVRLHFGITSFGVNAWTGVNAGDRIINEHDESQPDLAEELYLVLHGRASFELDGDKRDAPAGTFVFVQPGVTRTAFAEEPGTTILAVGGVPGPFDAFLTLRGGRGRGQTRTPPTKDRVLELARTTA